MPGGIGGARGGDVTLLERGTSRRPGCSAFVPISRDALDIVILRGVLDHLSDSLLAFRRFSALSPMVRCLASSYRWSSCGPCHCQAAPFRRPLRRAYVM